MGLCNIPRLFETSIAIDGPMSSKETLIAIIRQFNHFLQKIDIGMTEVQKKENRDFLEFSYDRIIWQICDLKKSGVSIGFSALYGSLDDHKFVVYQSPGDWLLHLHENE